MEISTGFVGDFPRQDKVSFLSLSKKINDPLGINLTQQANDM
jgi:hypothetical protein